MDNKLTIKLDEKIIERAKRYARKHNTSLSRIIENFLATMTAKDEGEDAGVTTLVKSLSGVIREEDIKKSGVDYSTYLKEKYSK